MLGAVVASALIGAAAAGGLGLIHLGAVDLLRGESHSANDYAVTLIKGAAIGAAFGAAFALLPAGGAALAEKSLAIGKFLVAAKPVATVALYGGLGLSGANYVNDIVSDGTGNNFIADKFFGGNREHYEVYSKVVMATTIVAGGMSALGAGAEVGLAKAAAAAEAAAAEAAAAKAAAAEASAAKAAAEGAIEGAGKGTNADIRKFSEYIFKEGAAPGKDIVFKNLGYTAEDSQMLVNIYHDQATAKYASNNYTLGKLDSFGQRINIEIELSGVRSAVGKTSYLQTGWMIRPDGSITLNTPFSGFFR
jgi:hypothetical protein